MRSLRSQTRVGGEQNSLSACEIAARRTLRLRNACCFTTMSSNVSNPIFFTLSGLTLFSVRVLRDNQMLLLHNEVFTAAFTTGLSLLRVELLHLSESLLPSSLRSRGQNVDCPPISLASLRTPHGRDDDVTTLPITTNEVTHLRAFPI